MAGKKNNQITGLFSALAFAVAFEARGKDIRVSRFPSEISYRSHEWVNEAGPDAGAHVSDWQGESGGRPLLVGHVGQGQVSFGHADGQRTVALGGWKHRRWENEFLMKQQRGEGMCVCVSGGGRPGILTCWW